MQRMGNKQLKDAPERERFHQLWVALRFTHMCFANQRFTEYVVCLLVCFNHPFSTFMVVVSISHGILWRVISKYVRRLAASLHQMIFLK